MLKNLKKLIKLSVISCVIFSLVSCSTIEIAHDPVGCLPDSTVRLGLSEKEIDVIFYAESWDSAVFCNKEKCLTINFGKNEIKITDKLIVFAASLRDKVKSQCLINKTHDQLHGDK
jgi:hypothetical protein